MDMISSIRKLAKGDEWQNLYVMAREIGSIKLFDNINDFSYIQNVFLRYLNFYYSIYSDIALGDVGEVVLEDFIYEEAYMMYKNRKDKEKFRNVQSHQYSKPKDEREINSLHTTKWIFKNKKQ